MKRISVIYNQNKKGGLTFRISAVLMVILLIFSTLPVSLAQQHVVQAQAETDASADISNKLKAKWFLLGGAGSTVGCLLGCVGGTLLGGGNSAGTSSISQTYFPWGGAILLGVCAVPIAAFTYSHNATPPPERLLGKSPEYIQTYTHAYKSRTALLRKIFITSGSVVGNLGVMTLIATFGFR